jgi:hypothetical protein
MQLMSLAATGQGNVSHKRRFCDTKALVARPFDLELDLKLTIHGATKAWGFADSRVGPIPQ